MLKKKQWFKKFRKILYILGCTDFMIEAFEMGAKENKEFISLTPKEAVDGYIDIKETLYNADKSWG